MTLKEFMEILSDFAGQAPDDAIVSINGEDVASIAVALQRSLGAFGEPGRVKTLGKDPVRPITLAIGVNGREIPEVKVTKYDFSKD